MSLSFVIIEDLYISLISTIINYMATDLGHSIKTAYFYVFSAIGIILLIVGVFKLSEFTVKKIFLDDYYLPYESGRCAYLEATKPIEGNVSPDSSTNQILIDQKVQCEADLAKERKVKEITDISSSITFIIVGLVLFVFHYRRARKLS